MIFQYTGRDPGSDSGKFIVIIDADSRAKSDNIFYEYLRSLKRLDLFTKGTVVQSDPIIIYSDVERLS